MREAQPLLSATGSVFLEANLLYVEGAALFMLDRPDEAEPRLVRAGQLYREEREPAVVYADMTLAGVRTTYQHKLAFNRPLFR